MNILICLTLFQVESEPTYFLLNLGILDHKK